MTLMNLFAANSGTTIDTNGASWKDVDGLNQTWRNRGISSTGGLLESFI